jgi:serine/threonine protein kinase/predicted ATPase
VAIDEQATPLEAYGPYRVVGLIARGGMGVVYRARHEQTQREVAVKTVRARRRDVLHWFRRELHALTRIRHRGLVQILEAGQTDGVPWYAMEFLQGLTLDNYLRDAWGRSTANGGPVAEAMHSSHATGPLFGTGPAGALPPGVPAARPGVGGPMPLAPAALRDFLTLMARLCGVLAYLHGEGIVHRDLKPRNIIVRPDGTPVLFDFGLASYFGAGGREYLQVGGKIEGTPHYMAPEQVRAEYVDARADLYAVGCMLYEGVTGRVPFRGETTAATLAACIRDEPIPPNRLVSGVPRALAELILRLLAKRPRDRIGHARAVIAVLSRLGAEVGDWLADQAARDYLYRPDFVGREAALATLEGRIHEGLAGVGRCVFLRGRSGAGKTRTLMELARRLGQAGMTVVSCECLPTRAGGAQDALGVRSGPLHPFRALLQAVADACLELGPGEADRLLGPRGKVLATCEPSLAALPGQERYPDPPPQSNDAVRARLMDALGETLVAFAQIAPFVVLLDDLQWADELTLHFLTLFQGGVWEAPQVAIVAAYRSEDEREVARSCGAALEGTALVDLGPLEETSLNDILREMLGADEVPQYVAQSTLEPAHGRFLRQLASRSQGNPFFVAELLRASVTEGILYRDEGGSWRVRQPLAENDEALPLPESLHELIIRRLDGLSPPAHQCLDMAAVFGRELEYDLLEGTGLLDADLLTALQELLAAQVLEECQPGQFRFLHDKLREVVYSQMAPDRRRDLHRTAALALEKCHAGRENFAQHYPTLAHHWHESIGDREAEPDRVTRAVEYLEKSAGEATQSGLALKAVEHGLAAARLLGADVPSEPEALGKALGAELEEIRRLLANRHPLDLLDLPPADDPGLDRLIGLLQTIHPAAHMSNQYYLSAFLAAANLRLTLDRGCGSTAPSVYALFTIVARNVLDDSRLADAFSRLAAAEDARRGRPLTAVVAFLRAWFVGHWVAPIRESLQTCRSGAEAALGAGDFLYYGFNHAAYVVFLAASGAPLADVIHTAEVHLDQIARRVLVAHFHCVLERQFARALAGLTRGPLSLTDDLFDEDRDLASICRTTNANQIGYYHTCRLKLHYYRGDAREALACADRALNLLPAIKGQAAEIDLILFQALALLAADFRDRVGVGHLEAARAHRATLARWAVDCTANFEHKLRLLDAEIARAEGRDGDAASAYVEAAHSADTFGFTQHSALAWELAGRHHARRGDATAARGAFGEALSRYQVWGASTVVDRLAAAEGFPVAHGPGTTRRVEGC